MPLESSQRTQPSSPTPALLSRLSPLIPPVMTLVTLHRSPLRCGFRPLHSVPFLPAAGMLPSAVSGEACFARPSRQADVLAGSGEFGTKAQEGEVEEELMEFEVLITIHKVHSSLSFHVVVVVLGPGRSGWPSAWGGPASEWACF